jgi:hypothetical protein
MARLPRVRATAALWSKLNLADVYLIKPLNLGTGQRAFIQRIIFGYSLPRNLSITLTCYFREEEKRVLVHKSIFSYREAILVVFFLFFLSL